MYLPYVGNDVVITFQVCVLAYTRRNRPGACPQGRGSPHWVITSN